ncbi:hypothetical protein Lal_00025578 [Lupinus albus]|uniref:Putative ribonuclease T(2) n=1 Tax=Lupinus albus TaxID=3870 RepID=A0A6A5NYZ6_LUPAL|nr:putative ribonuclease T(2) [Lupinus albus]KAF1890245.1 hypothetical protein Lal_00025578 [Lupinus albus]
MEFKGSNLIKLMLLTQCLTVLCNHSPKFDYFYFVQQWPGSYCDTRRPCCYPSTGKPAANFGIHGLWPQRNDGTYPSNCDHNHHFNSSQISNITLQLKIEWPTLSCPSNDGLKFWAHEWEKHGTCSKSKLEHHEYFESALKLKQIANLTQTLKNAGINPDGRSYPLIKIKEAIKKGTGFTPVIHCNVDKTGKSQIFEVYLCVNTTGSNFTECKVFPKSICKPSIVFPIF